METITYYCQEFTWPGLIFSVFVNIISSFIFIFALLYLLKPKIHIVPLIAKQDNPFDNDSRICHTFKIRNRSLFGAYDIEAKANTYSIRQGGNGIVNKLFHKIDLKTHRINYIPRNRVFDKKYGDNCIQFITYEDLSKEVRENNKYIQFQITARHSLTGLSNIFTYDFVDGTYIKEGFFVSGKSDEIKNS